MVREPARPEGDLSLGVSHAYSRHVRKIREEVGFVFQSFNLFPYYTALENVSLALEIVHPLNER